MRINIHQRISYDFTGISLDFAVNKMFQYILFMVIIITFLIKMLLYVACVLRRHTHKFFIAHIGACRSKLCSIVINSFFSV